MEPLLVLKESVDRTSENTATESIKVIIKQMRPEWDTADMKIKLLDGGYVNTVYKVENTVHGPTCSLVVRVYTEATHVLLTDSQLKDVLLSMRAAQKDGCGVKVFASFANGLVYQYQPGELMRPLEKYWNTEFRSRVVRMLARLNRVDYKSVGMSPEPKIFSLLKRARERIPDDFDKEIKGSDMLTSKSRLEKEIDWALSQVRKLDCEVSLIHGDCGFNNLVYDKATDTISLIDYDIAGPNYLPMDLAKIMTGVVDQILAGRYPLDQDEERLYCKLYLEEYHRLATGNQCRVEEGQIDILHALTKLFQMVNTLLLVCLCIPLLLEVPEKRDIAMKLAQTYDRTYVRCKEEYQTHKTRYPERFPKGWRLSPA